MRLVFPLPGREVFRREHGLVERFVVMYSGNHSPCHPLDTLLEAALRLKARAEFVFCFVGGGSEQQKVNAFASRHELNNIKVLPYQPLTMLSASLSAADMHVVVMGDEVRRHRSPVQDLQHHVCRNARSLYWTATKSRHRPSLTTRK